MVLIQIIGLLLVIFRWYLLLKLPVELVGPPRGHPL